MVRKSAMILAGFLTAAVLALSAMAFNVVTGEWVVFGAQPSMASALPADETTAFYTEASRPGPMRSTASERRCCRPRSPLFRAAWPNRTAPIKLNLVRLQEAVAEVEQTIEETTNDIGAFKRTHGHCSIRMQQGEAEFQQALAPVAGCGSPAVAAAA